MAYDHTPYWFWPLDRWKLLLTLILALTLLLVGAVNQPTPVAMTAPVLLHPSLGDIFAEGEIVEIEGSAAAEQVVSVLLCPFDADDLPRCDEESAYPLAEATADASGQWRVTTPPLAPGRHAIIATTAGDETDQALTSSVLIFKIQSPLPAAIAPSFDSPDRQKLLTQPIELTGQAGPGNAVYLFADATFLGSTYADKEGLWRFAFPKLDAGTHFLVAKVLAPDGEELGVSEPLIILVVSEP
jgi:hypothetical protein